MEYAYDEFNIQIGKRIKKLRLQRKYTREYLAECADISAKFLYEVETGKKAVRHMFYIVWRFHWELLLITFCRKNHSICCQNQNPYTKNYGKNKRESRTLLFVCYMNC